MSSNKTSKYLDELDKKMMIVMMMMIMSIKE